MPAPSSCAYSVRMAKTNDAAFRPVLNANTPKKAANLSVNGELLRMARELSINLSQTLEQALIAAIAERRAEVWLVENRAALEAYNVHIERDGVFSDGNRGF